MNSLEILSQFSPTELVAIALLVIWSLAWKGFALWTAAGLRHKYWFVVIFIINTFGILEIIYYFLVAKKYKVEVVEKTE